MIVKQALLAYDRFILDKSERQQELLCLNWIYKLLIKNLYIYLPTELRKMSNLTLLFLYCTFYIEHCRTSLSIAQRENVGFSGIMFFSNPYIWENHSHNIDGHKKSAYLTINAFQILFTKSIKL